MTGAASNVSAHAPSDAMSAAIPPMLRRTMFVTRKLLRSSRNTVAIRCEVTRETMPATNTQFTANIASPPMSNAPMSSGPEISGTSSTPWPPTAAYIAPAANTLNVYWAVLKRDFLAARRCSKSSVRLAMTWARMATDTPATPTRAKTNGAEVDSARSDLPARGRRIGLTSPAIVATTKNTVGHTAIFRAMLAQFVAIRIAASETSPRPVTIATYKSRREGRDKMRCLARSSPGSAGCVTSADRKRSISGRRACQYRPRRARPYISNAESMCP